MIFVDDMLTVFGDLLANYCRSSRERRDSEDRGSRRHTSKRRVDD
jgi:hypothetical protein